MKRASLAVLLLGGLLGTTWGAYRLASSSEPQLSRFVPSGALLYLQATDLTSLLADWDKSPEKDNWLKSKDHDVFAESRLMLRLKDAAHEFSSAAGVPTDASLLRQVAGKQTALALYDIGKLQFLYITRIPSADSMQSALWQTRSKFESRTAGGVNFFYRKDPDSEREVMFAIRGDYLFLATREDLMVGSLELQSGAKNQSIEDEAWWSRPVAAAGAPGDLRMVLNLEKIVSTPYFRSYWIQQNITEMKEFSAAISDLTRSLQEYREERTLLRKDAGAHTRVDENGAAGVAEILRVVPGNTAFYEAKADPDPKDTLDLLTTKILAPHLGPPVPEKLAPQVQLGSGESGSGADLETRIDLPPAQNPVAGDSRAPLEALVAKNRVLARLELQTTDRDSAGVFVRIHSALAFLGESDWDEHSVCAALAQFVRPALTTGQLGVEWKSVSGYRVLDGLWPLAIAVREKYLFISDDAALLTGTLEGLKKKANAPAAVFAAGFDHQGQRGNFVTLTRSLDHGARSAMSGGSPEFFSENIASLSFALQRVDSERVTIRDAGDRQTQTVIYSWGR